MSDPNADVCFPAPQQDVSSLDSADAVFSLLNRSPTLSLSHRHDVLARGLLKLGIFVAGDVKGSEDEVVAAILKSGATAAFYPHGVGESASSQLRQ